MQLIQKLGKHEKWILEPLGLTGPIRLLWGMNSIV